MELSFRVVLQRLSFLLLIFTGGRVAAQPGSTLLKWAPDGNSFYETKAGGIVRLTVADNRETVVVPREWLKPAGRVAPLSVRSFAFSEDGKKVLIFTNVKRVWRYD